MKGAVKAAVSALKGAVGGAKTRGIAETVTGLTMKTARDIGPLATVGLAAPAIGFAASEVVSPLIGGIGDYFSGGGAKRARAAQALEYKARAVAAGKKLEAERVQRGMSESLVKLRALDPALFQRVMAGRRLPVGAEVIGGVPRVDLLEELAQMMTLGQVPGQGGGQDLLSSLQQGGYNVRQTQGIGPKGPTSTLTIKSPPMSDGGDLSGLF